MSSIEERIVDTTENADRRDTYRMHKPEGHRHAELRIGKKLVNVEVLDESAGGFLISGSRIPHAKPTDTVELFSCNGAHFLRVAWRRSVDGRIRLGLQRVCHVPSEPESPWLVWFVAAMVVGIGFGFVAATSNNTNALDQILNAHQIVSKGTISTSSH